MAWIMLFFGLFLMVMSLFALSEAYQRNSPLTYREEMRSLAGVLGFLAVVLFLLAWWLGSMFGWS